MNWKGNGLIGREIF